MTVSTPDSVLFCPRCTSATVDVSSLIGGGASCRTCAWQGQREDCQVHAINHQFTSQEEIFRTFSRDVQLLVAEFGAVPIGRMLRKWGFLVDGPDGKPDMKVLTRYIKAIARGIATSLVAERESIEAEDVLRGQAGDANFYPLAVNTAGLRKAVGRG